MRLFLHSLSRVKHELTHPSLQGQRARRVREVRQGAQGPRQAHRGAQGRVPRLEPHVLDRRPDLVRRLVRPRRPCLIALSESRLADLVLVRPQPQRLGQALCARPRRVGGLQGDPLLWRQDVRGCVPVLFFTRALVALETDPLCARSSQAATTTRSTRTRARSATPSPSPRTRRRSSRSSSTSERVDRRGRGGGRAGSRASCRRRAAARREHALVGSLALHLETDTARCARLRARSCESEAREREQAISCTSSSLAPRLS